jgi:Domain of Unknown Function (DUF928)
MIVGKKNKVPSLAAAASAWLWIACLALPNTQAQTNAPAPVKPARVRAKLDGFDISSKSGKSPNQVGGASRGVCGGISLLAPATGKAYTLTPTFFWGPDDPQSEYVFRLMQVSASQNPPYETKVAGGHFTYPASAPALQPGAMYTWSVKCAIDELMTPASARFLIVGGSDRDAVAAALARAETSTDPAIAQANVFMDMRVWFDAFAAYSGLIDHYPARTEFYKARMDLYDQLPQTPDTKSLADADAAKTTR